MKTSVLILEKADGTLKAIPGKASALLSQLPSIRDAGQHDGDAIVEGVLLSTDRFAPFGAFKCKPAGKKKKG